MDPKKLWIGAEWQAERDHYGLDKRCGMFSTERFHEDDKGYVTADLTDALAEAAEDLIDSLDKIIHPAFVGYTKIEAARAALAALKAMEG